MEGRKEAWKMLPALKILTALWGKWGLQMRQHENNLTLSFVTSSAFRVEPSVLSRAKHPTLQGFPVTPALSLTRPYKGGFIHPPFKSQGLSIKEVKWLAPDTQQERVTARIWIQNYFWPQNISTRPLPLGLTAALEIAVYKGFLRRERAMGLEGRHIKESSRANKFLMLSS